MEQNTERTEKAIEEKLFSRAIKALLHNIIQEVVREVLQQTERMSACNKVFQKNDGSYTNKEEVQELEKQLKDCQIKYKVLLTKYNKQSKEEELNKIKISVLKKQVQELRDEVEVKQNRISIFQEEEKKIEGRKKAYDSLEKGWQIFYEYLQVTGKMKQKLQEVFVQPDNFQSFLCTCAQRETLPFLWDCMKECVSNTNESDVYSFIHKLFLYCIDCFNSTKTKKIYEEDGVVSGSPYNIQRHILAKGSPTQGSIGEILLRGYENVYANKVQRPSIVMLRK